MRAPPRRRTLGAKTMLTKLMRWAVRYGAFANIALAAASALMGATLVLVLGTTPLSEDTSTPLRFRFTHDRTADLTNQDALTQLLRTTQQATELPTNRSENPFWLLSEGLRSDLESSEFVELPSRHVQHIEFWFLDKNHRILSHGKSDRITPSSPFVHRVRAGFAVEVPKVTDEGGTYLLVRAQASGPARISMLQRTSEELKLSDQYFDRSGGVLFGSLLMIAAFSTLIALLSRDFTFFLFGAWVIASLRIASYSAGWDFGWLGYQQAELYPGLTRNLPISAYALFTVTLFWSIFRKDLASIRATKHIRILLLVCLLLVVAGAIVPHRNFLPLLWVTVAPCVVVLIWLTVRIFLKTGSSSAAWYGASWIATLAGGLNEIAFAAGLTSSKPTLLNSLGSAVVSALLAAIAVAQRLNSEKSARLLAQSKTLSALTKFRENYNSMPVGLFSINEMGSVKLFNPAFAEMFGITSNPAQSESINVEDLLGSGTLVSLQQAASTGREFEFEVSSGSPEASNHRWFLARVTSKEDSIEGSIQDITTRKQAENKLKHLVDHDSLTGLLNRRGLEQVLQAAAVAARAGTPCAIAHVDMDRFKLVNDLYGHAIGDGMLHAAAARLMNAIRTTDRVARLADSFIIVFTDCPDHAATRLTERLRETISDHPFELDGKSLNMTVSIGVVALDPEMSSVDSMAAADRACAEAKAHGRNCVVLLDEKDDALRTHLEELKVVAGLQQHVPVERYFLEFQPIVSLRAANQSLNYEVLIRMKGDDGGVVPPGKFIGAAERNGLMSQIDRWVLRSTLEWLDQHPAHRDRLSFATLNISGASLNDARFVDDAFSMIAEHPLAATKLCFEITESIALNDLGSTRRFVDRVRAFGSKLALDDFGAGYTSFNYLKEIPADFIKIDGSFVKDINRNPGNYAITRTIVDLTHELGMSSIAEWAETPDTIASLMELQVDYGQGFGLARPMAKELVTNAISSSSLVRDPSVLTLLAEGNRQMISLHPAGPRRS